MKGDFIKTVQYSYRKTRIADCYNAIPKYSYYTRIHSYTETWQIACLLANEAFTSYNDLEISREQ